MGTTTAAAVTAREKARAATAAKRRAAEDARKAQKRAEEEALKATETDLATFFDADAQIAEWESKKAAAVLRLTEKMTAAEVGELVGLTPAQVGTLATKARKAASAAEPAPAKSEPATASSSTAAPDAAQSEPPAPEERAAEAAPDGAASTAA